jgi:uncharacterized membrane protein
VFVSIELIPQWLQVSTTLITAIMLPACIRFADWGAVIRVPVRQHLLYASLIFLVLLWLISVRHIEGLLLHFAGVTTVTLLVGWRFTLLIGALATIAYTLLSGQQLAAAPLAWLLSVVVPASLSRLLVQWLQRIRFRNLFIYLLGAGFGGGILSAIGIAVAGLLVLAQTGQADRVSYALENWPMITLIAFPEGFINGMVLSVIVVWYPDTVKTFDSVKYLGDD